MAKFVFSNAFFSVDGVDLSDHVESLEISYSADAVESTAMGDNTRLNLGGLKTWGVSVTWRQDFAAASVDATLFAKVGTTSTLIIRPDAGVVSPTNREFAGPGLLTEYSPIGGSVGDVAAAPSTWVPAGDLTQVSA